MREVNKPISVIATFNIGEKPIPKKYKIKEDFRDIWHTVNIDEVTSIDARSLSFIDYDCISYYEEYQKRYVVRYYIKELSWFLVKSE